jgi:ubiquinone/menaquinone biosynthesis C-methylase UbiE
VNGHARWERAETVQSFVQSPPNRALLEYAARCREGIPSRRALDLGCGAGRNAIPLAHAGWHVVGVDTSSPMLAAASTRGAEAGVAATFLRAAMHALPFGDAVFDLVVAHGVWNLARSDAEFGRAVREAARVSRDGAALFVFTFSRHTLAAGAAPLPGQTLTFDQFSGEPQIFVTAKQLLSVLGDAGFRPDGAVPLTEHNRRATRMVASGGPVIYEGAFRYAAAG